MVSFEDEASNVLGWMSVACWIIVYSPQIILNYQLKSGEGLSVISIFIWLIADTSGLLAAFISGLLPTIIACGIYYVTCDTVLICQRYYYRWRYHTQVTKQREIATDEDTIPLLGTIWDEVPIIELSRASEPSRFSKRFAYTCSAIFVVSSGLIAWYIGAQDDEETGREEVISFQSQLLGWFSASLYFAARITQIFRNRKTHCAGLSLALYVFTITGNVTYAGMILVKSRDPQHLRASASFLVGCLECVLLDFVVLAQFFHYQKRPVAFTSGI